MADLIGTNWVAGSDHAGLALKRTLISELEALGASVADVGTHDETSVDYPDFGHAVAEQIASGQAQFGLLVCGSGIGISIAANRNPAVRAAVCHDVTAARLTRQHNDANAIAFGERLVGVEQAKDALKVFATTAFEAGRHTKRVDKLSAS